MFPLALKQHRAWPDTSIGRYSDNFLLSTLEFLFLQTKWDVQ